jgi:hypothetical protein
MDPSHATKQEMGSHHPKNQGWIQTHPKKTQNQTHAKLAIRYKWTVKRQLHYDGNTLNIGVRQIRFL